MAGNKAAKLFGKVRISQTYGQRWHDFTLQKGHMFGEDKDGFFVTAGEPRKHSTIIVYRCKGVPAANPDFYRWHAVLEHKGTELYAKIMQCKAENPGLKVEFKPLEKEKRIAPNPLRTSGKVREYKPMRIPYAGFKPVNKFVHREANPYL